MLLLLYFENKQKTKKKKTAANQQQQLNIDNNKKMVAFFFRNVATVTNFGLKSNSVKKFQKKGKVKGSKNNKNLIKNERCWKL